MDVIAHRGFADEAPENTVAAISRAADHADIVEFDVRRSGSGDPVVIHDATVDRVTDATGTVDSFSTDELAGLDVLGSGTGVPTLREVVDAVPADTALNVELKEAGIVDDVLATLGGHGGPVVVSSFSAALLRAVRRADPAVRTAFIAAHPRRRPVTRAIELGCSNVHLETRCCFVPRVVPTAHDLGLTVYAWTIDRRLVGRALAMRGVDGITVDSRAAVP